MPGGGLVIKDNLVLVGLPGSGKTALGEAIAEKLGLPFLDTDNIVEKTAGEGIPEIFANRGENSFREIEKEVVAKTAEIKNVVISSGGGAWLNLENRSNLKKNGITVYLECQLEEIWDRLNNSSKSRPLITKGFESLKELYHQRDAEYKKSDLVVDTTGKDFDFLCLEIIEKAGINKKNISCTSLEKFSINIPENLSYDVLVGSETIHFLPDILEERFCGIKEKKPRLFIITNPYVEAVCGRNFFEGLKKSGFESFVFIVPEGEEHKNLSWAAKSYSYLAQNSFDRGDLVLAVGGGVIGDLGGFVASTYMRGMPLVHIPTTLLAQVDSSIGGKTGVNLSEGKNLVGTFYQPDLVAADLELLKHLSDYHYRQGLAECVKYTLIDEQDFFNYFDSNVTEIQKRNAVVLQKMVIRCCKIKGEIVEKDEKEKGNRAVLNLGHTIGHALEASLGYGKIGHGDAVALGIKAEAFASVKLGKISKDSLKRIEKILSNLNFPEKANFLTANAMEFLARDKKRKRGQVRFALPVEKGGVELIEVSDSFLLEEAFKYVEE